MPQKRTPTLKELVDSGVIKELSPELALKSIEGYVDEIEPAARADEAFYRQFSCPRCAGSMAKEFIGGPRGRGVTWVEGSVLPRAMLRCVDCRLLMNPHTSMIIEPGSSVAAAKKAAED